MSASASCIFRIEDNLFQVLDLGEGATVQSLDEVSEIEDNRPDSSDDIRIIDVEIDMQDHEILIVAEVENGDVHSSANESSPTISDLLRLERSETPDFEEFEDLDITKYKLPFVGDDGEVVPGKYNILLKLPEDEQSGFYRLEW